MISWLPNVTISFAYDEQHAMDTVVVGGDPNATVEGLIVKNWIKTKTCYFNGEVGIIFMCWTIYIDTLGNQFPFTYIAMPLT